MTSSVPTLGSKVVCEYRGERRVGSITRFVPLPGGGFLVRVDFDHAPDFSFVPLALTEPADLIDEVLDAATGSV